MKAEYKRDLQNNYLILEAPKEAREDEYMIRMAEQNKIAGMLPFHSTRKDGALLFYYEITSRQPLNSLYEKKKMSFHDMITLLSSIEDTMENLQKYLLNPLQVIFDPQYIYVGADRNKIMLCYFPGAENSFPITDLAEFILRKLDHEDKKAVKLGYGFYQRTLEENFSLQSVLKELMTELKEDRGENSAAQPGTLSSVKEKMTYEFPGYEGDDDEYFCAEMVEEPEVIHKERRGKETGRTDRKDNKKGKKDNRENKRNDKNSKKVTERLFERIHPAVLLSALFLLALLEIVFYMELVSITEAGGLFFLIVSVEMLFHKRWKDKKEKMERQQEQWTEEEESEAYRELQEEMYDIPGQEEIQETCCLVPDSQKEGLRLICTRPGDREDGIPEIFLGQKVLYVGKIKGESDIILNSPTVSRVHARLEGRDGTYYVKDLNSKNGTFCNGKRLHPQEQCELKEGDRIAFAEIEYKAVRC